MAVSRGIVKDKTRGAERHRHSPTQNGQKVQSAEGAKTFGLFADVAVFSGRLLGASFGPERSPASPESRLLQQFL